MTTSEESKASEEAEKKKSKFNACYKIVSAIIILTVLALDPFGLTSASDTASANVVNKILSFYYPNTAQRQITVILIDDISLDAMDAHWPLSYQQQSKLYRNILNYKPKALFIDLLYTHDRSNDKDNIVVLNNTLERYQDIPIFIPKPMQPGLKDSPQFKYAKPVFVQWHGTEHYYPRQFQNMTSPAQALYQLHCEQQECAMIPASTPAMAVQWGSQISSIQQQFSYTNHCQPNNRSVLNVLKILVSDIFWKTTKEWLQPCPYHITINAAQLLANDDNAKQLFSELIEGKYVFFGAYIQGARDDIISPIHGKIPGVYLHSMAFDNLLTYGESHFRPSHEIKGNLNVSDVIDAIFFILFMLMKDFTAPSTSRGDIRQQAHWYHTWRLPVVMASSMLTTALLFAIVLHYEPINWLGLSMLFLLITYQKFISYKIIYLLKLLLTATQKTKIKQRSEPHENDNF